VKNWRIVVILLLCLALAGAIGCGGDQEEASPQEVEVVRGDLIVSVSGSGNIVVSNKANLTFGSSGKIAKIYVEEGDEVDEGDILAKLDTDYLELALTQAQVALTGQEIAVSQAEINVTKAEIALEKAEDAWLDTESAGNKVKRLKRSLEWELENDPEDTEKIKMEVELAKQSVEQTKHSLQQSQQSVEQAQKQLDEATITASFDGVVASVDADEGDSVSATMTIINLIDPDTMELEVEVDEIDIAEVKRWTHCQLFSLRARLNLFLPCP